MRTTALVAATVFAFGLPATSLAATTNVTFVDPDHFIDAGGKGGFGDVPTKEVVLRELRAHLEGLGQRNLPASQTLKIEIIDVDIAGRREVLGRGTDDVRVYDQLSAPRIRLRFTLEEYGRVVRSGEDRLSEPNYLSSPTRSASRETLYHERAMLTKWFLGRFGSAT